MREVVDELHVQLPELNEKLLTFTLLDDLPTKDDPVCRLTKDVSKDPVGVLRKVELKNCG